MKTILILLIMISSLFANYTVSYNNLKLGTIQDINTVDENYFKAKVTNPLARFLLGKKELIFFNEKYEQTRTLKNVKYKKDKYFIIEIIKRSISNSLEEGKIYISENKYIDISKNGNFKFKYVSKGRVKSFGNIVIKDKTLISLIDEKNKIIILKN